jgi:predicted oxidoreductase (fatty acid repression mutant protein)
MTLAELSFDQKRKLKTDYWQEVKGNVLSYEDMENIDNLVTEEELKMYYDQYDFTEEDF